MESPSSSYCSLKGSRHLYISQEVGRPCVCTTAFKVGMHEATGHSILSVRVTPDRRDTALSNMWCRDV